MVIPICTLLHELGHAITALLLTSHKVTIQLGKQGIKWRVQLGRLTILWYLGFGAVWGVYQSEGQGEIRPNRNIWILLGGPATSLLFAILFGSLDVFSDGAVPFLDIFATGNLIAFLITVLPWHYPKWMGVMGGIPSDVLSAWRLIKQSSREI
jgi:peptidoglycan/LPS O-acetylase OafA/YrhL